MKQLFQLIRDRLSADEALVLVTVTATTGAAPRGAGARMLVGQEGRLYGTIGGGAVEYRSEQIAQTVLQEQTSLDKDFSLTRNDTFLPAIPKPWLLPLMLCSAWMPEPTSGSSVT